MLKSKMFVKKTRRGGVMKIVREHYLRDDIWCGARHCSSCDMAADVTADTCETKTASRALLEQHPPSYSSSCDFPHYLVLDTNAILHQMDVLEDPMIQNVIILQTVLQEAKHKSYTAYKRLREVIDVPEKKFYVFCNEHHRDTYKDRLKDETPNDYNDRIIRKASSWYAKHLDEHCMPAEPNDRVSIVLLTNDMGNKEKAEQEGIEVYTVNEYIRSLTGRSDLVEKLAKTAAYGKDEGKTIFPEHLSFAVIQTGIKTGKYMQGSFVASRENYLEGVVRVTGQEEEVFIQGLEHLNRAVHDDIVAIEILPREQWVAPSALILEEKDEELEEKEQKENVEASLRKRKLKVDIKRTGKIIGIIKRKWRPYCGMLSPRGNAKGLKHLFVAANRQIPRIQIESRQGEVLRMKKIIVAIDAWPRTSRYPQGHYVRDLGEVGDKATENEVLLLEHDIPHQPFSKKVLADLPKMPWIIKQEDYDERRDLRGVNICSIDPPGCTDIDDALHCRPMDNGHFEVGVHIADVTHFIKPNTAIDEEAISRGTTCYLVDQRIDMVPELLSANLCSLHEKVERFAFSCVWEMTRDAEIVAVDFFKSIIKSKAAMTYAEAQMIIDDASRTDDLSKSLRDLCDLSKKLKAKRIEAGALTLASQEVRFKIDSETHDPISMQTKEMMDTNSLVEEFMLLANISVAKKIYEHFPQYAVLRCHPIPSASMFETLIKSAASIGVEISAATGKDLQVSLNAAAFPDDPYKNIILRILTTRSMTQALYFCSGAEKFDNFLHYGLATPIYTHFTSPIRRYPDVMVHRLLGVACGAYDSSPELIDMKKINNYCQHMNYRHKMAQDAGRASVSLHTQIFFKSRVCDEEGYVLFVRKNALQVLIPKYGLEGTVYLSEKSTAESSLFTYDEEKLSQTCGSLILRVFDRVIVQVSIQKKNPQSSFMQLKLVEPVIAGFSVPPLETNMDEPSNKKPKFS